MTNSKSLHPSAPADLSIVVAACENISDTQAMIRWILPVLESWPKSAWHVWIADASNCNDIRAAKLDTDTANLDWKPVSHTPDGGADPVCQVIGGRTGIVIYAHNLVAHEASRNLEGLVAAMTAFPANDPLAHPIQRSFASFGVTAGT